MEVKILGKSYSLRSDVDPSFAQETASLVNQRMKEFLSKSGNLSPEKIAVLAALNFAGELLRTREGAKTQNQEIRKRMNKILKLIHSKH